jgi:uncharacterized YigZ family protein
MKTTFNTIDRGGKGSFRDKGSRFLAFAFPVSGIGAVQEILDALRKDYHDARHHCYAYRIGMDGETWRANDDGEPGGSAGKPIHGQMLSLEVTNVLVVVVRYFGGTKLGIPGLIHAYRTAARDALMDGDIITKPITHDLVIRFGYEHMNNVMKLIKDEEIHIVNNQFDLQCMIQGYVATDRLLRTTEALNKLEGVQWATPGCS